MACLSIFLSTEKLRRESNDVGNDTAHFNLAKQLTAFSHNAYLNRISSTKGRSQWPENLKTDPPDNTSALSLTLARVLTEAMAPISPGRTECQYSFHRKNAS